MPPRKNKKNRKPKSETQEPHSSKTMSPVRTPVSADALFEQVGRNGHPQNIVPNGQSLTVQQVEDGMRRESYSTPTQSRSHTPNQNEAVEMNKTSTKRLNPSAPHFYPENLNGQQNINGSHPVQQAQPNQSRQAQYVPVSPVSPAGPVAPTGTPVNFPIIQSYGQYMQRLHNLSHSMTPLPAPHMMVPHSLLTNRSMFHPPNIGVSYFVVYPAYPLRAPPPNRQILF